MGTVTAKEELLASRRNLNLSLASIEAAAMTWQQESPFTMVLLIAAGMACQSAKSQWPLLPLGALWGYQHLCGCPRML